MCMCVHACVREERHLRTVSIVVYYSIRYTGEEYGGAGLGGLTLQILVNTIIGNWF